MKLKYESVTGYVEEVEISAEIGAYITADRREEENANRRHRYHAAYSLDGAVYEGDDFATDDTPESACIRDYENEQLYAALDTLTDTQRRRLEMFADGLTFREIARREGVSHKQVSKSIEQARTKIKKIYEKN